MRTIGIIPARMAASRFPGKPMFPILGRPMLEHVYHRAKLYSHWDELVIATCDQEIFNFAKSKNFPVFMTGSHHTRALDRVAEAGTMFTQKLEDEDVVVCVQGDEPMLAPDMMDAVIAPLKNDKSIPATVLAMHITEEEIWRNPDTVKIIHNAKGEVLYTSRMPLPYCKGNFSPELGARRIYGIFAFRWKYLQEFTKHPETRLEQLEACDSNRILDMNFTQYIAPYPYVQSYSVDSPSDIGLVENHIQKDKYYNLY
ncbi:putative 3-deoxy-D-manno-octulosonate cytidylyltransferase [Leptospira weilii serovar Ranarum str. ICFT]|uniref:3-deoxy-D-manno-octulosonate cytidylyltransferase n=1 Tax=Leptospira weilii serovar Ranarum str. ICFT TaxID=1218598 RepID=N1WBI2_9LEPT|nr:3-deoxy-manno-octulosonate cytidylyltransferase [Leptospira weilii]EMY76300.1 putative 3-deoxy-D-manno-octulosonate cytidylyltransferase [Leptospira weilii serovar Ranarum str. ICFT]